MDVVLTRPAAASSELLLAQFVWTFPTPATLTPPSGWTLVDHVFGTQIQESVYQQSGPLAAANETWVISSNQAWSASVMNVGTATIAGFSHASGTSALPAVVAPVAVGAATDIAIAFYGALNLNPITGSQSPGCGMQSSHVSSFWEYALSYITAINISGTLSLSAAWVEIMVVLSGTPAIVPSVTCPVFNASGG